MKEEPTVSNNPIPKRQKAPIAYNNARTITPAGLLISFPARAKLAKERYAEPAEESIPPRKRTLADLVAYNRMMPTTLETILASTRLRVAEAKSRVKAPALERLASEHAPRGFARALRDHAHAGMAVIAELKKASPSKGLIRAEFNPAELAKELVSAGATALSVLTDELYFQGSLDYLASVSRSVDVPLLRKDFIIDKFQVMEARAYRADAILLIVAALSDAELRTLQQTAREFELDVLCEVHDEEELQRAIDSGAVMIGVNSRNLKTFHVDLNTALRVGERIPANVLRVAESGIGSGDDIEKLRRAGYDAFLIGESLMRAERPGRALQVLLQGRMAAR
jgi:indole-3-glycerol phosphate synthase